MERFHALIQLMTTQLASWRQIFWVGWRGLGLVGYEGKQCELGGIFCHLFMPLVIPIEDIGMDIHHC